MKMKLDKKFQPMSRDEGDEFFPNGIFEFNITKLIAHIKASPDHFPIEEVPLEGQFGLRDSSCLDEATIQKANPASPIILAEISPGRFNVIDGNHRVERAKRDGAKFIRAYKVGPDQHYRFITSAESYKKYVEYWNSKVRDIEKRARLTQTSASL